MVRGIEGSSDGENGGQIWRCMLDHLSAFLFSFDRDVR